MRGRTTCLSLLSLAAALIFFSVAGPAAADPTFDHLLCYKSKDPAVLKGTVVDLLTRELAVAKNCKIKKAAEVCVPVVKSVVTLGAGVDAENPQFRNGDASSMICYKISCDAVDATVRSVLDQFGARDVSAGKPFKLCALAVETADCKAAGRHFVGTEDDCNDLEESECTSAWQISDGNGLPTSCFYGINAHGETGCYGCGPYNQAAGACTEVCSTLPVPSCTAAGRTFTMDCRDLSGDESACNAAWQISDGTDLPTSCFYGANAYGETGCYGCGPYNQAAGVCTEVCSNEPPPACAAAGRTFAIDCRDLADDEDACNTVWEISGDTDLPTSCFYGVDTRGAAGCHGCGPYDQAGGLCTEVCSNEPVPACAPAGPTFLPNCGSLDNDEAACNAAWQISDGTGEPTSCFHGVNFLGYTGCYGCGPFNEFGGHCQNVCVAP